MRVRILLLLILKSRTLTTITQRIERGVKKSGIMQQYSGTPGVKSNFRDYPGKSGRVGRSAAGPGSEYRPYRLCIQLEGG